MENITKQNRNKIMSANVSNTDPHLWLSVFCCFVKHFSFVCSHKEVSGQRLYPGTLTGHQMRLG